jgi:hypothetical protein
MKKYYLVTTKFYDNGRVETSMRTEEHKDKPKDDSDNTDECDIYYDWFTRERDAKAWQKDALNA